jgi:hypothetical protein
MPKPMHNAAFDPRRRRGEECQIKARVNGALATARQA